MVGREHFTALEFTLRSPISSICGIERRRQRHGIMEHLFSIHCMTEHRAADLIFAGDMTPAAFEFLELFGTFDGDRFAMVGFQQATTELKSAVAAYCAKYSREVPRSNAFGKLIRDLREDEAFLILPHAPASTREKLAHEYVLALFNGTVTPEEVASQDALFDAVLADYEITTPRTDRHTLIGNKRRADRTCRFCYRTVADGATFDSNAHAISAALGNRFLKLADECDDCNGYFGRELEPHLIALLDLPRVMLGIQGRGKNEGRPEVSFDDGRIYNDGERVIIECPSESVRQTAEGLTIDMAGGFSVIPERCYRALVKIALSVIPAEELAHLHATVKWVRHGQRPDGRAMPLISFNRVAFPPDRCAQITLYVRRSGRSRLPHVVGEFRLGCYLFVFTLPFSARDGVDLAFFNDPKFMALCTRGWMAHVRLQQYGGDRQGTVAPCEERSNGRSVARDLRPRSCRASGLNRDPVSTRL